MEQIESFFDKSNEVVHLNTKISKKFCNEDCILGIDEAGRGPVLGPMVYAAAYYPISMKQNLEHKKFQDSKTLTEKERSEMFELINEYEIGWNATIITPVFISNSMLKRSKYNLNAMSHDAAIALIQKSLDDGVQLKEVYLDTVGPANKYQEKLELIFPNLKVTVSNKADSLYKIVSVASICAKFIRDYIIKNWKFIENLPYGESEYGSGYPSDPKTKQFLKETFDPLFGFPTFVRFSWSTITKIMDERSIPCKWDDDDEEDESQENINESICNYFKSNKVTKPEMKSSSFFMDRGIQQIKSIDNLEY